MFPSWGDRRAERTRGHGRRSRPASRAPLLRCPISTQKHLNRATKALLFTKILAGITQHVSAAIVLGGKSFTPQQLAAVFQAALQAESDLDAARSVVEAKLKAKDDTQTAADALVADLRKAVEAQYGADSPVVGDFGFQPKKKVVRSTAVKAKAAQKSSATRAAHKKALAAPAPTAEPPAPPALPPATPPANKQ